MTSVSAVLFPRACLRACVCVSVCVRMIQQLVQLRSVTAARPPQRRAKQTPGFYFDISCGLLANPCRRRVRLRPRSVFGSVRYRSVAFGWCSAYRPAERRVFAERSACPSFSHLPVDFLEICSSCPLVSDSFCSGLTWTHPPRRPAAFIQPSLLSTFPPFYAWCSVLPAGECSRRVVLTRVIKESSLKIQQ